MSSEGPSSSQGLQRNYKLINNKKGGKTLLHAGHSYIFKRNSKFSSVWVCTKRRHEKCTGSVKIINISDNAQIQMKHSSHCKPDFIKNEVGVVMDKIKKEVTTNYTSVKKIFEMRTAELKNKGFDADIPIYTDVKTTLYDHRNRALKVPKTRFKEPCDVIIPEKFRTHILFDYKQTDSRIIIFTAKKAFTEIKNVSYFFCDGTFDCCPYPFKQIFTIHADIGCKNTSDTNVVPMFYALLINKEKDTYKKVFTLIRENLPDFNPSKFILDFEMSAILAISEVFPQASIHGCFVHFQRSLYRKAKSLGLMEHEETAEYIKLCASLAFLPKEDIEDGWLAVMENSYSDEQITKFNDYFVEQWLEPEEMITKWCCYKERHRTTNLVEAWNQRIQIYLGRQPSLLSFLEMIDLDICTYDTAQERLQRDEISISKRTTKSKKNDEAIAKLTAEYDEKKIPIISFLSNIRPFVVLKQKLKRHK